METEVIRISVSEDKDIMELLSRMYEIKNKENKDVECEYKGKIVTTKECKPLLPPKNPSSPPRVTAAISDKL